jgi:hypothetical protein
VQDGEDVVALHRGDDVLGAADHLGEPFLHLLAGDAGVVLELRAGQRGHHRRAGDAGRRRAQFLHEREGDGGQVALVAGDGEGLGQVLQRLVEQDEAGGVGFEQVGQLDGRRAPQLVVLVRHLAVGGGAAEPVGELAEERVAPGAAQVGVDLAGGQRAAFEDHDLGLGEVLAAEPDGQFLGEVRRRHLGGVAEEVVGGQQRVGLPAAELGLQAIDTGGGHVPREAGGQLRQEGFEVGGQVGLLAERDRIAVVGRAAAPVDEPEVGGEEGLVEGAVGDVPPGFGHLPPRSEGAHRPTIPSGRRPDGVPRSEGRSGHARAPCSLIPAAPCGSLRGCA